MYALLPFTCPVKSAYAYREEELHKYAIPGTRASLASLAAAHKHNTDNNVLCDIQAAGWWGAERCLIEFARVLSQRAIEAALPMRLDHEIRYLINQLPSDWERQDYPAWQRDFGVTHLTAQHILMCSSPEAYRGTFGVRNRHFRPHVLPLSPDDNPQLPRDDIDELKDALETCKRLVCDRRIRARALQSVLEAGARATAEERCRAWAWLADEPVPLQVRVNYVYHKDSRAIRLGVGQLSMHRGRLGRGRFFVRVAAWSKKVEPYNTGYPYTIHGAAQEVNSPEGWLRDYLS